MADQRKPEEFLFGNIVELHAGKGQADLLLFVPRNNIGRTIDDLTGRYGYSHLAIDCGEIDVPTGRRVMIESTVAPGVHYAFLEEYGERPYIRIPLQNTGMDVQEFMLVPQESSFSEALRLAAATFSVLKTKPVVFVAINQSQKAGQKSKP